MKIVIPCDITPAVNRIFDEIKANLIETAKQVKPGDALNEEQKFAIAFAAGVPFTTTYEDGTFSMTTEPCAVVNVNGQWQVFRKDTNDTP